MTGVARRALRRSRADGPADPQQPLRRRRCDQRRSKGRRSTASCSRRRRSTTRTPTCSIRSGGPRLPTTGRSRRPESLRERVEREFLVTLWDDLEIWRYQKYVEHPALAQQDARPYGSLRKWAQAVLRARAVNDGDLEPALVAWLVDVTGTDDLTSTVAPAARRVPGTRSTRGVPTASTAELWLRTDPGFGPQSGTLYSLRREAAVYRALGDTPVRVARARRRPPRRARVPDATGAAARAGSRRSPTPTSSSPSRASSSTSWSTLHRLDPSAARPPRARPARRDLRPRARRDRRVGHAVRHRRRRGPRHLARVVMVAGPRARRRRLAGRARAGRHRAGQLHVRRRPARRRSPTGSSRTGAISTTTSRGCWCATPSSGSPSSTPGCAEYEHASGFTIDPARLRYFRVLAQFRATIGTLAGLRTRDRRGEIAWQLMYNTLHTRPAGRGARRRRGRRAPPPLAGPRRRRAEQLGVRRRARRPPRRRGPRARPRLRRDAREGRRPAAQVPARGRPPRARVRRRRSSTRSARCSGDRSTTSSRAAGRLHRDRAGCARPPARSSPTACVRPRATPRRCAPRWVRSPTAISRRCDERQEDTTP